LFGVAGSSLSHTSLNYTRIGPPTCNWSAITAELPGGIPSPRRLRSS
jgi:hypothetical protein